MNNLLLGGIVSHTERARIHAMNSPLGRAKMGIHHQEGGAGGGGPEPHPGKPPPGPGGPPPNPNAEKDLRMKQQGHILERRFKSGINAGGEILVKGAQGADYAGEKTKKALKKGYELGTKAMNPFETAEKALINARGAAQENRYKNKGKKSKGNK